MATNYSICPKCQKEDNVMRFRDGGSQKCITCDYGWHYCKNGKIIDNFINKCSVCTEEQQLLKERKEMVRINQEQLLKEREEMVRTNQEQLLKEREEMVRTNQEQLLKERENIK